MIKSDTFISPLHMTREHQIGHRHVTLPKSLSQQTNMIYSIFLAVSNNAAAAQLISTGTLKT